MYTQIPERKVLNEVALNTPKDSHTIRENESSPQKHKSTQKSTDSTTEIEEAEIRYPNNKQESKSK